MITQLMPKLAVATVAAVAMYVPTLGMPMLGLCIGTGGVASAAPSPTCGSDLRECLRLSAKTGIYGARYVTAEDVAKCVEAFNSCIHGTANGNPNPPTSTSGTNHSRKGLPTHFGIKHREGSFSDCRVTGDTVTCTESWEDGTDSYTGKLTGNVAGWTLTGRRTTHRHGHTPDDPGCVVDETYSGPVAYVFTPDGGATFTAGPNQRQSNFSGSCSGSNAGTTSVMQGTATWTPME